MHKILAFFLLFSLAAYGLCARGIPQQPVHKKHTVKRKTTAKDSIHDSVAKAPSSKTIKAPPKKTASKNKTASKEPVEKQDSEPEEKDTVKVTFGKNIVNLRTFNGWILDDKGKWIHSPNRIPFANPEYNNELYTKYKLGADNIKQINVYQIYIDSTPYLAIMIEQYKGRYRYHMDSDFFYFIGTDYYLIKREDFKKLWNDTMKMKQPYQASIRIWYSGLVGYKDLKLRPKYIAMEINKDLRNRKFTDTSVKAYLQFGLRPFQSKRGRFMRFYYGLAYAKTGAPVPPFDINIFKQRFYEADLDLFHKFCRPPGLSTIMLKKNKKPTVPVKPAPKPGEEPPPVED